MQTGKQKLHYLSALEFFSLNFICDFYHYCFGLIYDLYVYYFGLIYGFLLPRVVDKELWKPGEIYLARQDCLHKKIDKVCQAHEPKGCII